MKNMRVDVRVRVTLKVGQMWPSCVIFFFLQFTSVIFIFRNTFHYTLNISPPPRYKMLGILINRKSTSRITHLR